MHKFKKVPVGRSKLFRKKTATIRILMYRLPWIRVIASRNAFAQAVIRALQSRKDSHRPVLTSPWYACDGSAQRKSWMYLQSKRPRQGSGSSDATVQRHQGAEALRRRRPMAAPSFRYPADTASAATAFMEWRGRRAHPQRPHGRPPHNTLSGAAAMT